MLKLTSEREKVMAALAERYAISADAVKLMVDAVAKGRGSMACKLDRVTARAARAVEGDGNSYR